MTPSHRQGPPAQGSGRADQWRNRGSYFSWVPPGSSAPPVQIFHVESGEPEAPVLLLVHGFPTCSIDWFGLVDRLQSRFRVCALDFPGYGFSDKWPDWGYSLARDAQLLQYYVQEVLAADSVVVIGHDRGSSVALQFVLSSAAEAPAHSVTRLEHLVLTNGNIYLPLSNLTEFQRVVLDESRAGSLLRMLTPAMLATGMGASTFSPPRAADDPDVQALAATFAHAGGISVLHETIQYLVERAAHERQWLDSLAGADIPTTVIWGLNDTVSPPRVATYVWNEFLMLKPGRNRLYFVPDANHYLQVDRPDAVMTALLHALDPQSAPAPGALGVEPGSPILVDSSRLRLPSASELLLPPS
jgi:pimeloyl-ACP methyl ester carboxylesterase